jgi:hypothetical protein
MPKILNLKEEGMDAFFVKNRQMSNKIAEFGVWLS